MSKSQLHKTAYEYIKGNIGKLHGFSYDIDYPSPIPLSELKLLKEGFTHPSPGLVALLKQLLRGSVTEAEIDASLVAPF
ncbi:hypothetical protein ACFLT4_06765 [Chloroflexota bacterium]